jgi:hypothetical protein
VSAMTHSGSKLQFGIACRQARPFALLMDLLSVCWEWIGVQQQVGALLFGMSRCGYRRPAGASTCWRPLATSEGKHTWRRVMTA